jgi:hypothetical protein
MFFLKGFKFDEVIDMEEDLMVVRSLTLSDANLVLFGFM